MKRIAIIMVVFLILISTACTRKNKNENKVMPNNPTHIEERTAENEQNEQNPLAPSPDIKRKEIDLDRLVKEYQYTNRTTLEFEPETDGLGLPLELVNEFKEAFCKGESDAWIRNRDDESLMITMNDFVFLPNQGKKIGYYEKEFNRTIRMDKPELYFYFYRCDINGDGEDEILVVDDFGDENPGQGCIYLLMKSGGGYVFTAYEELDDCRRFAIFQYNGRYYLAANYDEYETETITGVRLLDISGSSDSESLWKGHKKQVYIQKTTEEYDYRIFYDNENAPITKNVQAYVEEIGVDLMVTDRLEGTFYGDETEREDLLEKARENDKDFWEVYAIDVNNDGMEEYFDRRILDQEDEDMYESKVVWFDSETCTEYPAPFEVWRPLHYFLSQMWFQVIDGKTVIFSLYYEPSMDAYLLDARMKEGGQTVALLDYVIEVNPVVTASNEWVYGESNEIGIEYDNPDARKAYPNNLNKRMDDFAKKVKGDFQAVNHKDKNIPNDLILKMEKALYDKNLQELDLGSASMEINRGDFYRKYGKQINLSKKDIYHIYKYSLENQNYYLMTVEADGTAGFIYIMVYKEKDGRLKSWDGLLSRDSNARVIRYGNGLYLIEQQPYNEDSQYTDSISIYQLSSNRIKEYVNVRLAPGVFKWKRIYNNKQFNKKAITEYINSIKDDLMAKLLMHFDWQVYVGDEANTFDQDRYQRLKSVFGYDDFSDYYEIDYDNDGFKEYIKKYFWFPYNYGKHYYIIDEIYKFTDKQVVSIESDLFGEDKMLIQLWFKEIEGRVYTFRLFHNDDYRYVLNVSLIEDAKITQVRSYIIAGKEKFTVKSFENKNKNSTNAN